MWLPGPAPARCTLRERLTVKSSASTTVPDNVDRANAAAAGDGLAGRVRFAQGDSERLPVADESFDAIFCECAFLHVSGQVSRGARVPPGVARRWPVGHKRYHPCKYASGRIAKP